jgi:hypothetical protein
MVGRVMDIVEIEVVDYVDPAKVSVGVGAHHGRHPAFEDSGCTRVHKKLLFMAV